MSTVVTLWWLGFWTALGLCIGSFLNAVIYRLPRHGSLRSPRWSACPVCSHRIAWYDNLPILSFLHLRGRCRHCGVPIGTRYLVVEASMAVVVLMLIDAFFIAQERVGLCRSPIGLTEELLLDWPILLSHVVLFACLFCMSVIDLEHYWVDIRFTNLAALAGFALHTIWTPRHSMTWVRPHDATAGASILALIGLAIVWLFLRARARTESDHSMVQEEPALSEGQATAPPQPAPETISNATNQPSRIFAWATGLLLIGLFVELFFVETGRAALPFGPRAFVPLLLFFLMVVSESTTIRAADVLIIEAIEEERPYAQRASLEELLLLLPAIVLGILGWWWMTAGGAWAERGAAALHFEVPLPGGWLRHWSPLYGFATAASGFIIAGAVGWTVRIVFTLILGKEAFGTGDIHLMAAAGCVAGWPVVVLAFFLTCLLALLGWLLVLPFKRTRALPLGPWLSLSILAVVVFYEPIVRSPMIRSITAAANFFLFQGSQDH